MQKSEEDHVIAEVRILSDEHEKTIAFFENKGHHRAAQFVRIVHAMKIRSRGSLCLREGSLNLKLSSDDIIVAHTHKF